MWKRILSIFLVLLFISASFGQGMPIVVDPNLYNFNSSVATPDTSLSINVNYSSIIGGQLDVYIYQYPLLNGSDATSDAQVKLQTSCPNVGRQFGRTSFSVDAAIYGFTIQVYDGVDAVGGNPCGSHTTHLSDEVACANPVGLGSPGLQLDLSSKDFFVTEILSQDIPAGANIIVRVWDSQGHTGYIGYIYPGAVVQPINPLAPYKPLLFFAFNNFTNAQNINWSNIRALAIEFNSTVAAVDLVIGPIQALGTNFTKSTTTPQPVQPNRQVDFKINVFPDIYETSFISQLIDPISYNVTIVDTLPAEFIGFNVSTISLIDQNGTAIQFTTSINGSTATFSFFFDNGQYPTLSYSAILPSTYTFCRKSVCNNASLTIVSYSSSMETTKTVSTSSCVRLASTPSISVAYTQCPTLFNNTLSYNATVCNSGNGPASNASFYHTSSGSLSSCLLTFPSAVCNGANCRLSVGDIPAGTCLSVPFQYDCSSFNQTCVSLDFGSSITTNETCMNTTSTVSCPLTFTPNTSNVVLTNSCPSNILPNITSSRLISQVCNNGDGVARNVFYYHIASDSLLGCTISSLNGTCNGSNCTISLGNIAPHTCVNVEIDYDCSSFNQTCSPLNFNSTTYVSELCRGQIPSQQCSFNLNPGTPNVQITNSCPSNLSPSNTTTQLISHVCNTGTGFAQNVQFTHTPSGSLTSCNASLVNGTCTGATCSIALGLIAPSQCINVEINYNCPSFAQTCSLLTFNSTLSATERCANPVSNQSCAFVLNPGTPLVQITIPTPPSNLSPSNTSTRLVSHVCNNGNGIAQNVQFTHTPSGSLTTCSASLVNGTCTGATCSIALGNIAPSQCINVEIDFSCPSSAQTCSLLTFNSTLSATEGCATNVTSVPSAFVLNPGTPLVQITIPTPPSNLSPSNTTTRLVSHVCNNGNGIAQNVQFTHNPSSSLTTCSASLVNGTCTGATCSIALGNIAPSQCIDVVIDFSCPSSAQTCSLLTFNSTLSATERCATNVTSVTSAFVLNPGTPLVQISVPSSPSNLSPSNTTTRLVSHVCNNGNGIAQNVQFTHTPSGSLTTCSASLVNGTCSGATCSIALGNIAPSQCIDVVIDFSCPSSAQTCSLLTFNSTLSATERCATNVTSVSSAFILNPGTPLVQITNTCPSNLYLNSTSRNITSEVCNNGNGTAQNVQFTFRPLSSLSSCSFNVENATCTSSSCVLSLGNIEAGKCVSVRTALDCSSFNQTCSPKNFIAEYTSTEGCLTNVPPTNCSFLLVSGTASLQAYSPVCPPSLTENSTNINYTARVCNNGDGFARNVLFTQNAYDALTQCTVSFPTGSCTGSTCTQSLGTIAPGECQDVRVSYDCSVFAKSCIPRHFNSDYSFSENCSNSNSTSFHCTVVLGPGTSNITTEFVTCPLFNSTTLQSSSVSQVCNKGDGIARNVLFTHSLNSVLSQCTPSISTGVCNGRICTSQLGDFQPGHCLNVTVNYNCSNLLDQCIIRPFRATSNVTETCGSFSQQKSCVFSINSKYMVHVSETLLNTSPARTGQVITWNITGTNYGRNSIVHTYTISKVYPNYTSPTPDTLALWNCDQQALTCNYTSSTLLNGTSISLLFAVRVLSTIPLSTKQLCNVVNMTTPLNETNCYAFSNTSNCAAVEPNLPDLVLRKRVAATQYTFPVKYTNSGTGTANNLVLQETLQPGWSIDSSSSNNGWNCVGSSCTQTIPSVPSAISGGNEGTSLFVVNVNPTFQLLSNGSTQCWVNFVNSTYDELGFDPTPNNNFAYSPSIGSSCQGCCQPVACEPAVCVETCPPPNLIVDCPTVTCNCVVPEFWCPSCETKAPACNCNQCISTGVQFA